MKLSINESGTGKKLIVISLFGKVIIKQRHNEPYTLNAKQLKSS